MSKSVNVYLNQQKEISVKNLLQLAQLFARKSRRPSTQLFCLDLLNAMETMEISPPRKTTTIYYLRHFEALHNIPPHNYQLVDPRLSPRGEEQAAKTNEILRDLFPFDLIVCSPLTRTLQTYLLINDRSSIPLIIHPDLQEVCDVPCDTGRSIDELKRDFPSLNEHLEIFRQTFGENEWRDKHHVESLYHRDRIDERARRIRQWLIERSEQRILVISHNLMIKTLFQLDGESVELKNGEIRRKEYSS